MRRCIFKREIESVFSHHNIDKPTQQKILDSLIPGIKSDISEQYVLLDSIKTPEDIEKVLSGFSDNIISDIKSIFFISSDLELPPSILEAIEQKESIGIFTGSGVSKLIGLPLWDELALKAIDYLLKNNFISYIEANFIKHETTAKRKLSILHNTISLQEQKFFYADAFKPDPKIKINPYSILSKINIPKFSINIDEEFWNAISDNFNQNVESDTSKIPIFPYSRNHKDFDEKTEIEPNTLYQLHGTLSRFEEYSIITMEQYITHYYSKISKLRDFLEKIGSTCKLIFLGCGMEEMEFLAPLIKGKRHLVVIGTYIGEKRYFEIQKRYFDTNLNMDTHGYYLDFNGFSRLYDLIKSWGEKINFEMKKNFYDITDGEFNGINL